MLLNSYYKNNIDKEISYLPTSMRDSRERRPNIMVAHGKVKKDPRWLLAHEIETFAMRCCHVSKFLLCLLI